MSLSSVISAATQLQASVQAARPLRRATSLRKAALINAGNALISDIDGSLAAAVGALDADDPTGFAGSLENALLALSDAASEQAALATIRGAVGRSVFNLGQL